MSASQAREPWRGPVLVSALLHGGVITLMALNLSWCSSDIKLPPLPAHVKAVVVDRAQAAPRLPEPPLEPVAEPEPLPEPPAPAPKPEPKKPEPKKPEPKKPEPKKPEPKKPEPKKPEPKKPEPKKPVPAPDFDALLDQEDRSLAERADARRASNQRVAEEASAAAAAEAKAVADYKARILEALRQRWSRPPSARNGMSVTLQVNVIPGGEVVGTPAVLKSSGDAAFDRSAQNAVLLASPLPVPADPVIFNRHFRQFRFVARPEDLKQ